MSDKQTEQTNFIRFELAVKRTELANERTFLSYFRASIMLFASAATLMKVYENTHLMFYLGISLLPLATVVLLTGIARFRRVSSSMRQDESSMLAEVKKHAEDISS